jgi:hypothetical protein
MSWEHHYYQATCRRCGAKGFKIESSDDWGRFKTSWKGFTPLPTPDYLVARKKGGENAYARCACGSTDIEVGTTIVKSLPGQVWQEFIDGQRALWRNPWLRSMVRIGIVANLALTLFNV